MNWVIQVCLSQSKNVWTVWFNERFTINKIRTKASKRNKYIKSLQNKYISWVGWNFYENVISEGGGKGVEIRMSWLEKKWKINNQHWGGMPVRHQRVQIHFHLSLWEDLLIFLSLLVQNYCKFVLLNNVVKIKIKLNCKYTKQS